MKRTPPKHTVSLHRLFGLFLLSFFIGWGGDWLGPPISTISIGLSLLVLVLIARDLHRMLDLKSWWVPGWTLVAVVMGAIAMMQDDALSPIGVLAQGLSGVAALVVLHTLQSTLYMRS